MHASATANLVLPTPDASDRIVSAPSSAPLIISDMIVPLIDLPILPTLPKLLIISSIESAAVHDSTLLSWTNSFSNDRTFFLIAVKISSTSSDSNLSLTSAALGFTRFSI